MLQCSIPTAGERPGTAILSEASQDAQLRKAWFAVLCPNQKPHLLLARTLGSTMNQRSRAPYMTLALLLISTPPLFKTKASCPGQFFQHNSRRAQPDLPGAPGSCTIAKARHLAFKDRCRSDHLVTHNCEPQRPWSTNTRP